MSRGDRVAILLPDGPGIHVAFVACEKAGLVAVGIGPRAGLAEIRIDGQSSFGQLTSELEHFARGSSTIDA